MFLEICSSLGFDNFGAMLISDLIISQTICLILHELPCYDFFFFYHVEEYLLSLDNILCDIVGIIELEQLLFKHDFSLCAEYSKKFRTHPNSSEFLTGSGDLKYNLYI